MLRAALPAAVRPPFPSGPCVPPGAPILREAVALAFRAGCTDASGSWGAAPSVFWFLLYAQKERPGGEPYRLCTLHILRDADRRPQIWLKNSFASFCRSKRKAPPARRADRHLPVTPRRRRRPQTIPCRVGIQILISKRPRLAARRLPT